jgi:nitrogen regulatory protein P-II 1
MKKIEAIIRKTKFEDVKEALLAADIEWFSYYDVLTSESRRKVSISTSMVRAATTKVLSYIDERDY